MANKNIIGKNSKIHIHWKVSPYDYSKEKENEVIHQAAQKYSLPKDRIKVIPEFRVLNKKGKEISIAHEVVQNIQRPDFQVQLFKRYILDNQIKDFDFDLIRAIDADINAHIDYDVYDKYRKYKIKWVKWKNFLSYGDNNFFDFRTLSDLVLLNGEPANQSGKTTFAIELIHFLFYGKVEKYDVQSKIFNSHRPEATEVFVEGCIEIEGQEYLIRRRLTRPALSRRSEKSKTLQKVEYYRINNGELTELEDSADNHQEENSAQTNKVIKETIGNENDFDMIICATGKNLDDLIEKKDTERGRLLSRWIGLLPIEQKEQIAREKFNSEIKPYLLSSRYDKNTLMHEIETFKVNIFGLNETLGRYKNRIGEIDNEIKTLEENQKSLLLSKTKIDNALLKIDITTLEKKINNILEAGKIKKNELDELNAVISELSKVSFSIEEFNTKLEEKTTISTKLAEVAHEYTDLQKLVETLRTSEYCPTCGRKYENVDNSLKINETLVLLDKKKQEGIELKTKLASLNTHIEYLKDEQDKYYRKCKLEAKKGATEASLEQFRNGYVENKRLLVEYEKNNEAIDRNNKLDIQINNNEVTISSKRKEKEVTLTSILKVETDIANYENGIKEREEVIKKLADEAVKLQNWKLYLEMIGKNGISKMLLRQVIPVINAQISALLNDVCDFTVELDITEKNDVMFYLVKDDVRTDLTGGSGFERTAAALALRSVLGNISTLPRMSGLVLDEIWGRVAKENYDNLRKLLEEIGKSFDFILIISHLDEVKDFCKTIITVTKKDNVSSLKTTVNTVAK